MNFLGKKIQERSVLWLSNSEWKIFCFPSFFFVAVVNKVFWKTIVTIGGSLSRSISVFSCFFAALSGKFRPPVGSFCRSVQDCRLQVPVNIFRKMTYSQGRHCMIFPSLLNVELEQFSFSSKNFRWGCQSCFSQVPSKISRDMISFENTDCFYYLFRTLSVKFLASFQKFSVKLHKLPLNVPRISFRSKVFFENKNCFLILFGHWA